MKKVIVMLMGTSGSGKSHLENNLARLYPDEFHRVVSATTRPQRPKEVGGVDYHFHTLDSFRNLNLIQRTSFAEQCYGSELREYTTMHRYATLVITPNSAVTFLLNLEAVIKGVRTVIVYFDISSEQLYKNMRSRGDAHLDIVARLDKDDLKKQFHESNLTANFTVTDDMLTDDLPWDVFNFLEHETT